LALSRLLIFKSCDCSTACHQYTSTDVATLQSCVTWISFVVTRTINLYVSISRPRRDLLLSWSGELWSGIMTPLKASRRWRPVKRAPLMTKRSVYRSGVIDQLSPVRVTTSHWPLDPWPRPT